MQSGNNKFVYISNKIADMVIVSVLWLVCSLPVITAGASTSALYHAVIKAVREDKSYAASSFWDAFKMNLKQSTCFHAGTLVCLAAFACSAYGMHHYMGNFAANVYFVFSCICFCVVIVIQLHAYFLIGRFEIRGREFWTVLLKLSGQSIGNNIVMLLVGVFAVEIALYYPPLVLVVPAGFVYVISFVEEKRFGTYIKLRD